LGNRDVEVIERELELADGAGTDPSVRQRCNDAVAATFDGWDAVSSTWT
jgi:hypothetical protein